MRYLRIPYYYLPTYLLLKHLNFSRIALNVIHDIHHDIPNKKWWIKSARAYMYYPIFLCWVHAKARRELRRRKTKPSVTTLVENHDLRPEILKLRTKPLSDFIPPKDDDLAADVVWLLDYKYTKEGMNLPYSYLELARQYYGDEVDERSHQGIDYAQGSHRDADRGWYLT